MHTSAQLSSALATAQPGDTIILDAGATYNGYFTLPAKSNPNNKWIYLVSSGLANLPAGTRVSPSNAQYMAKIVSPNTASPITVGNGANYWRLAGLELTAQSSYPSGCPGKGQNCMTYFIMNIQNLTGALANHIYLDRMYAHGSPTQDFQGGLIINWDWAAVIDSYVDDVHIKGFDSVGVGGYHMTGPIKIVNNYISASTENIMFGGSGGNGNPGVPSDIEIRNNYLYKPLSWVTASVTNNAMVVKNAFEVKSGQRILFDSNVIENVWAHGQLGYGIVMGARTAQSGDFAVVNDITITNNVLNNVVSGVNGGAVDYQCGVAPYPNCLNAGSQDRWYISNNLILFYDPKTLGGNRNVGMALNGSYDNIRRIPGTLRDIVFQHNTLVSNASQPCWNSIFFSSNGQSYPFAVPLTNNIWILDNALCNQPTGDYGLQGTAGLTQYMGSPAPLDTRYKGNVMYVPTGNKLQTFPLHNYASPVPFTYEATAYSDYQLLTPYWTDTSDGRLAGINTASLRNALANRGRTIYAGTVPSAAVVKR